ncbi:MAG: cytochrome c oxidase subunit 4 [Psychromonas sp.]|jgi:cytochrome c oxidase subunit 4
MQTESKKRIFISYLALIAFTLISAIIGEFANPETVFSETNIVITISLIVIIKEQKIVDVFMELKHAPKLWRYLLLSYVVLVPSIIAGIYLIF